MIFEMGYFLNLAVLQPANVTNGGDHVCIFLKLWTNDHIKKY